MGQERFVSESIAHANLPGVKHAGNRILHAGPRDQGVQERPELASRTLPFPSGEAVEQNVFGVRCAIAVHLAGNVPARRVLGVADALQLPAFVVAVEVAVDVVWVPFARRRVTQVRLRAGQGHRSGETQDDARCRESRHLQVWNMRDDVKCINYIIN